jgi:DNA-binding XRE family transcriptional regulator
MHIQGMKLEQYLKTAGLTDEQFSSIVGVSRPTITRIRNGSHMPSVKTALAISRASDGQVSLDDLLGASA